MTDKELRKLSRLELLELLLKESRENEKLKAELEKQKIENSIEKTTERLEKTANQFNTSFQSLETLVSMMKGFISENKPESSESSTEYSPEHLEDYLTFKTKKMSADTDLYKRLMQHFARNTDKLTYLPHELKEDIITRLAELQGKTKFTEKDNH